MLYILLFSLPFLLSFVKIKKSYVKLYRYRDNYASKESMPIPIPIPYPIYKDQEKNTTVTSEKIEKFIENLKKMREEEDKWDCGEVEWEM